MIQVGQDMEMIGLEKGYVFVQPDPKKGKGKPVKYHIAPLAEESETGCRMIFEVFDVQSESMEASGVCRSCLKSGVGVIRGYDKEIEGMINDVEKKADVPVESSIDFVNSVRDIVKDMDILHGQVNKEHPILGVALKGIREKVQGLSRSSR